MGKPDFARYSQDQLRQILTRLDAERYPERVEEVERRLAALETPPTSAGWVVDVPLGERQRISSNIYPVLNRVVSSLGIVIWLVFCVSFIFSPEKQGTGWLMLVLLFVLGMLGQFAINRFTEEVFLVDDLLILVQAGREEMVPLTRIDCVEVINGEDVSVVLHLSSVSIFGQRIEFVPAAGFIVNPFKEIPVVDVLRARIAAAKARATCI